MKIIWPLVHLAWLLPAIAASAAEPDPPAEPSRTALAVEALSRLQGADLDANPRLKEAVLNVLEKTRGTASFVKLVQQFKLAGQDAGLLEVAVAHPASDAGVEALRLILANRNLALLQNALQGANAAAALKIAEGLGHAGDRQAVPLLLAVIRETPRDAALRKQAVRSLAQSSVGANALLDLARQDQIADDLKFTASSELHRARWPEIKEQAAKVLPLPPGQDSRPLPPVADLLAMKGNPANGEKLFARPTVGCGNCHVVRGQGVDFGPNLSEIGGKLAREAFYEAILDPSAGISFGYEAWQINLKSGDEAYGLLASETADELAIKTAGGIVSRYKKSDIKERQRMKLSIMPTGLQQTMTAQELVDLVEYLTTLKPAGGDR